MTGRWGGGGLVGLATCLFATLAWANPPQLARREPPVRVAIVGDSVAVNLGDGLLRFGRSRRALLVQVFAHRGCGIARSAYQDPTLARGCDNWQRRWGAGLRKFDPEIVLVVTAGWDVSDRRLREGGDLLPIGDPRVDAFLAREYAALVELLSARGALVAFLTSPCTKPHPVASTRQLNDAIIAPLADAFPERVAVIDLHARVCKDGAVLDEIEGMQGVRPDGIHFSLEASVWLAAWLSPEIEALVKARREN